MLKPTTIAEPDHVVAPADAIPESQPTTTWRPPAVPLVAVDPYFSIWSFTDELTGSFPKHWTGQNHSMTGMIRIDGKAYRFCGPQPEDVPAMEQLACEVLPTRTLYRFGAGGVQLDLVFTTPALPTDFDTFSWPVTYVTFSASSLDGKPHDVQVYFDVCAEVVVDNSAQKVTWSRLRSAAAQILSLGSSYQHVLGKSGDDLRIDWGYFYLVLPHSLDADFVIQPKQEVQDAWAADGPAGGTLPDEDDLVRPRAVNDGWPGLICSFPLPVSPEAPSSKFLMLAYDDIFSVEFINRRMPGYWNRHNIGAGTMLTAAVRDYTSLQHKCAAFDVMMMARFEKVGGPDYARLAALAYRQTLAAHKLVADIDGTPIYLSKENFSNGCVGTVDVTYPSAPFFLLLNPELLKAQLTPIFVYANSHRWKFPFAPHDLGTYPLANGQVYGGGERSEKFQMPVEECGNMLILTAALVKADKAHLAYAEKYWPHLERWARYLLERGFDPEKQLCTDDFAGRLAHNTNLSIKAILALGGFADLCRQRGLDADYRQFRDAAESMVQAWLTHARDESRGQVHYRLAFDKPATWSQKYNLVWDTVLDLHLFPPEVAQAEMAFYLQQQLRYGLPLDNRKAYTKLDWVFWTACLTGSRKDFDALATPVYHWVSESTSRVPLTDHYWADTGEQVMHFSGKMGFQARSVVGGIYMPMLAKMGDG